MLMVKDRRKAAALAPLLVSALTVAACAKHADFLEVREQLSAISRAQEHDRQRLDSALRRIDSVERSKDAEPGRQRLDDLSVRLQKIEGRLAKLEEAVVQASIRTDPSSALKSTKQVPSGDAPAGAPGITPTAAFNLAYNDYLNGKYELAVAGFQRFLKDFPVTSLSPNAQYWLGESYYKMKDYGHAIQAFESLVAEYPGNEKIPAALYKLGLATAETGDLAKSRKNLKRVLEEFPGSEESRMAKIKLAEIR